MAAPTQYIVDFSDADALTAVLNEYFAVGVVPVSSDNAPRAMTPVRLHVILPLERELFFTGIVIMLRPGGFLVQLDSLPNMQFLHDTLRDHALSLIKEPPQPRPVTDDIYDGAEFDDPLRTSARTERMGAISEPPRGGGTIPGFTHIRMPLENPAPGVEDSYDEHEPPATKPEKTRPGVRKTGRRPAVQDSSEFGDEFDVTISAVDAVTGQAKPSRERTTGRHKRPVFETHQFGRDMPVDDDDIPVYVDQPPAARTRKQEFPDVSGTARMKAVRKSVSAPASPVDELFEMAETAGAPGLGQDSHGDPGVDNDEFDLDGRTRAIRPQIDRQAAEIQEPEQPLPPGEQDPFDDDKSGQLDRELAVSIREMSVPEKQRLARQGKRVARRILIRDNDKTIHKFVFFNPEVKIDEVIEYTRSNSLAADAIEFICTNKQWMDSHDVILNIVRNIATPLELAVRFVIKLTPADWRMLTRPGVVRPAIMNQARRLLQSTE